MQMSPGIKNPDDICYPGFFMSVFAFKKYSIAL